MLGHDVNETRGAIVEATDAVLATLSARLDALLASWQLAMAAKRNAPTAASNVPTRTASEVLAELEGELANLERRCAEQREAADAEAHVAEDWERRAMEAVRNGSDDHAKQALLQVHNHGNYAALLEATATELVAVRDSYRNAVTAVRATITGSATA